MPKKKAQGVPLSEGILSLAFMKDLREEYELEQEEIEGSAMFGREITEGMKKDGDKYIMESSYMRIENLVNGRVSYQGMNPEIERLMKIAEKKKRPLDEDGEMSKDITDEEMAQFSSSLVDTMASKFQNKSNKKLFVKPEID